MPELFDNEEFADDATDASADVPRLVIMDKRLLEALEILGVNVYEST